MQYNDHHREASESAVVCSITKIVTESFEYEKFLNLTHVNIVTSGKSCLD